MLTEADLVTAVGLVARLRRTEAEYLRTRISTKAEELFKQLDGLRWTLLNEYGVRVELYGKDPGPDGKAVA